MKQIKIFDTTLRDGEQSPGASLNKEEKIRIARQLEKLGVDIIEAGFPISSEDDFEAVKQIAFEIKESTVCGLARTIKEDIDRCWEAIKYAKKSRIHVFVATSNIHLDKKLELSKNEILEMIRNMVSYAKSLCDDVEFSPEDASRTDKDFMLDVIKTAINSGATTINIPDTVGYAIPEEFGKRINFVFENLGDLIDEKGVTISVHCHNDLGNAVANSLAAVKNGATQIECTINGLGERAGNCSLEEVVMNLKVRKDYYDSEVNINTGELFNTSKLVSELTGIAVQRNKAIVGLNAFAHEAGIHQHGVLKDKSTYEIMSPKDVGWHGENIVVGKHSGKHAVREILKNEGISFDEIEIIEITKRVKDLADSKKDITKTEIIAIVNDLNNEKDF